MSVYYNEFDPFAAAWLAELMRDGLIPAGDIDTRSIVDVKPDDVRGYTQAHFFAGIGGWAYALSLAGWGGRSIWTGSCPCQPFSAAGKRRGTADERHLWPVWFDLIRQCRPPVVFGEQVSSSEVVGSELEASFVVAVREGRFADANRLAHKLATSKALHFHPRWVDGIRADLEGENYTFRHEVLGAHSVGAPHIRQRLYWLADADGRLAGHGHLQPGGQHGQQPQDGGVGRRVAHPDSQGQPGQPLNGEMAGFGSECAVGLEHPAGDGRQQRRAEPVGRGAAGGCGDGGLGDATSSRQLEGRSPASRHVDQGHRSTYTSRLGDTDDERSQGRVVGRHGVDERPAGSPGVGGFWSRAEWLACSDGKARRVEPGIFPLAHGVPNRVGTLRGAGNAIVPQVAAEFIRAYLDITD
jgi:DNA (cytosine-5)-methyltransferase 1